MDLDISNDNTYVIWNDEEPIEEFDNDLPFHEIVEIDIESQFDKNIRYSRSSSCCKDQHIFYWIPASLLGMKHLQDKINKK